MAVARYTTWRPRDRAQALVQALDEACRRASAGGVRLTLGQAYYRLVLAGALPNTDPARKQLGKIAARARMAGLLDWDLLSDGTSVHHPPLSVAASGPATATDSRTGSGSMSHRSGPLREVWIEKDGLAGLVADVAASAGIGWTSCDGLPSLAHLHRAALRFAAAIQDGQPVVLLYLGDHDAHGAVVERDLRGQLTAMVASHHLSRHQDLAGTRTRGAVLARVLDHMRIHLDGADPLTFRRVALTRAQAEHLRLPGDGAGGWEIEAADPLWLRGRLTHAIAGGGELGEPDPVAEPAGAHDGDPAGITDFAADDDLNTRADVAGAPRADQEGAAR